VFVRQKMGKTVPSFIKQRLNIDGIFLPPFLSNEPGPGRYIVFCRKPWIWSRYPAVLKRWVKGKWMGKRASGTTGGQGKRQRKERGLGGWCGVVRGWGRSGLGGGWGGGKVEGEQFPLTHNK
jgi:hypothetical protein